MADKPQPVEFYTELLRQSKTLRDKRVPVRVHPTVADGGQQHWLRGNLVDTQGENVVVAPLHGKQRQVTVPATAVKLWDSRMNNELQKLAERLRAEFNKPVVKAVINNPMFEVTAPKPAVPKPVFPATAPHPVEALKTLVETEHPTEAEIMDEPEIPEPEVETLPPALPVEIMRNAPQGFVEKLNLFKQLKDELSRKAGTEGLAKLRALHKDLEEAREMVTVVENEIATICLELSEFGVAIPADLDVTNVKKAKSLTLPTASPSRPNPFQSPTSVAKVDEEPADEPDETEPDESDEKPEATEIPVDSTDPAVYKNKNNWCGGKARKHRDKIIEYFAKNSNYWTSGVQLMQYCGETTAAPSTVLMPLVEDGTLKRIGVRSNVRYCLNMANAKQ